MATDRLFWNRFSLFETSHLQAKLACSFYSKCLAWVQSRIVDPHSAGSADSEGAKGSAFVLTFPVPTCSLILVKLGWCQAGKTACSRVTFVARRLTSLVMPFCSLTFQLPPLDLVSEPCTSGLSSSIWPCLALTHSLSPTWPQCLSFGGSCQVMTANEIKFAYLS